MSVIDQPALIISEVEWSLGTLADLVESSNNGFGKRGQAEGTPYVVLRLADVRNGEVQLDEVRRINAVEKGAVSYTLRPSDLLVIRVNGSPELVGRVALAPICEEPVLFCDHFIRLRLKDSRYAKYLRYFADTPEARRFVELNKVSSAGQNTVSQAVLLRMPIRIPSPEQAQAAVEEIETQLSRLDAGVTALKRAQANLKRYRAAVLQSACEVYEGWSASTIGESIQIIDYRGRTPPFSSEGIPHLRSQNVKGGKVVWDGITYVSQDTYDAYMTRGIPKEGDLLFTTEAPMGEVAPVPNCQFSLAQRIMVLRPDRELWDWRHLRYQLISPTFRRS